MRVVGAIIAVLAFATAGCGECRASFIEFEKVLILEDGALEVNYGGSAERCLALCGEEGTGRLDSCVTGVVIVDEEELPAVACRYSQYADCGTQP